MPDDGKLSGHAALVAGACGGLGRAIAKALAAEDCQMHLADIDEAGLDNIADDISDTYDMEVDVYPTDLADSINASALVLEADVVSILINAFGTVPSGNIDSLDPDDWQDGFDRRVFGAINLSREVLEDMQDLESGIIVNVGCPVEADSPSDQLCIKTVNAALTAFSENLDTQTKPDGIRILTFLPDAEMSPDEQAAALTTLVCSKLSS